MKLSLVAAILMLAPAAHAETAARISASQSASPAVSGLPVTAVTQWLASQGLTVGPLEGEADAPRVQISSDGLTWTLNFNGCQNQVCGDLQFGAGFRNPTVTETKVNEWNTRNRFLKSFYIAPAQAGGEGTGMVQYDVIVLPTLGVEQLSDPLAVWRGLLPAFAAHIGYFVSEPAATAPAP